MPTSRVDHICPMVATSSISAAGGDRTAALFHRKFCVTHHTYRRREAIFDAMFSLDWCNIPRKWWHVTGGDGCGGGELNAVTTFGWIGWSVWLLEVYWLFVDESIKKGRGWIDLISPAGYECIGRGGGGGCGCGELDDDGVNDGGSLGELDGGWDCWRWINCIALFCWMDELGWLAGWTINFTMSLVFY